jgi:hypothetical protein
VLLGRLQLGPGGVELRPGRFLELRESQEPQSGDLRALEEAWTMTSRFRHFSVKFGRFLCFRRCLRLKVRGCWRLKGGGWKLRVEGWKLRVEGWKLRVRSWRLRVGGWWLRGGGWRPKARGRRPWFEG